MKQGKEPSVKNVKENGNWQQMEGFVEVSSWAGFTAYVPTAQRLDISDLEQR